MKASKESQLVTYNQLQHLRRKARAMGGKLDKVALRDYGILEYTNKDKVVLKAFGARNNKATVLIDLTNLV